MVTTGALSWLGYAGMVLLALHEAWFGVRHAFKCNHHVRCECPPQTRYLTGRTFHGHVVNDATYWRRSNNVKTKDGHCSAFQKLPGFQRHLARTGPVLAVFGAMVSPVLTVALVVPAAVGWVLLTGPGQRVIWRAWGPAWRWSCRVAWSRLGGLVLRVVPGPVTAWSGRLLEDRGLPKRLTEHHGARTQDLAQGLASITGTSAAAVKRAIEWNPGYAATEQGGLVAKWYLPRGFKGDSKEQAKANELWQGRIGFELTPQWNLADARPHVNFIRARSLPDIVYLEEYAPYLAKLPPNQTGLGLDDMGELVVADTKVENPHELVVAGSRHGKTELNRSKVAQTTRKGGYVAAADCKRISFQGLEGVPGFELRNNPRDIRGMWELIRRSYEELDRRAKEREDNPTAEFDPWRLCIEELGQFSEMTGDWWDELDFEDPRDEGTLFFRRKGRKIPRVWRYIKSLCFEGAEFEMFVSISGQDGDHQYLKGLKPVLGLRMLGGYQDNQWLNCVGTRPVPQAPDIKGRFCLVNGRKQTWFQAFVGSLDKLESAAIWRDYARAGRRMDGSQPPVTETVPQRSVTYLVDTKGQVTDVNALEPGAVTDDHRGVRISLSDAIDGGYVPGASLKALRMDRYRSDRGELPPGLVFPQVAGMRGKNTELFWSGELSAFNSARRGTHPAGGIPDDRQPPTRSGDVDPDLLLLAAELVISAQYGSAQMLQRKLRTGWEETQRLMGLLEDQGIVGPAEGDGPREVLVPVAGLDVRLGELREAANTAETIATGR